MIVKIAATVTLISAVAGGAISVAVASLAFLHVNLPVTFLLLFFGIDLVLLYGVFERRSPVFGKIFWKGAADRPEIAVTFDDGPNGPYTAKLLDILKECGVRATFFVLGQNAEKYPEAIVRMAAEGHETGNHAYSHEVLPLKRPDAIRDEIRKTSAIIERLSGRRPTLFRAPHGWRNPWVSRAAKELGCTPVAWTLGVWDTDRPGAGVIVKRAVSGAQNGCVLLLHDGRGLEEGADSSQLIEALPLILDELGRRGYRFVTVSEMLGQKDR